MSAKTAPVIVTYRTSLSVEEARKKIAEVIRHTQGKLQYDRPGEMAARYGSLFKMRLLGVMMAGVEVYPRYVEVVFSNADEHTYMKITVTDEAGKGSQKGITDAVKQLFLRDIQWFIAPFNDLQEV